MSGATMSIGTSTANTTVLGKATGVNTLAAPTLVSKPCGLYADAGSTAISNLLTGGDTTLAVTWGESLDVSAYWTVNQGSAGFIRYTNSSTRYFHITVTLAVSKGAGTTGTIGVMLRKDTAGNGTYAQIAANTALQTLVASENHMMSIALCATVAQNDTFQLWITGDNNDTYTFAYSGIAITQML